MTIHSSTTEAIAASSAVLNEIQLIDFGNYLLKRYGVMVHSTDGTNVPLYERSVSDADMANWKHECHIPVGQLPSRFQRGDKAIFEVRTDSKELPYFGIPCEILNVTFCRGGKVKYDLDLLFADNKRSRVYNVDSDLVVPE